jgi:hypothetical protein
MHSGWNRRVATLALGLAMAGASACTATRAVRPVGEGRWAAGASLGGPVFTNLGAPIPTPLLSGYGRYGLSERTDFEFGLHAPIARNLGVDLGAAHLLLEQQGLRPAVMVNGRVYLYGNLAGLSGKERGSGTGFTLAPRIFEEVQATASWKVAEPLLLYAGLNVFAQVEGAKFHPTALIGAQWRPVPLFALGLEAKQVAFTTDQLFAVVDFIGPASYGALAVQLGLNFYPGSN